MKKYLLATCAITLCLGICEGQNLSKTYYFNSPQLFNPSFIGLESHLEAKIGSQKSYLGNPDAPSIQYGYLNGAFKGTIKKKRRGNIRYKSPYDIDKLASDIKPKFNGMRISHPDLVHKYVKDSINRAVRNLDRANRNKLRRRLQTTKFEADFHHGAGIMILRQEASPFGSNKVSGQYALHIPLSANWIMSAGLSVGFINSSFSSDKVLIEDSADPIYIKYSTGGANFNYLTLTNGFSFYSEKTIVSYAFQNMLVQDAGEGGIDFFDTYESKVHHMSLFHTTEFNPELIAQFGIYSRLGSRSQNQALLSSKFIYQHKFGFSTAFSFNNILIPGISLFVNDGLRANYLVDIPLNNDISENKLGHEISLQFLIKQKAAPTPYFY